MVAVATLLFLPCRAGIEQKSDFLAVAFSLTPHFAVVLRNSDGTAAMASSVTAATRECSGDCF